MCRSTPLYFQRVEWTSKIFWMKFGGVQFELSETARTGGAGWHHHARAGRGPAHSHHRLILVLAAVGLTLAAVVCRQTGREAGRLSTGACFTVEVTQQPEPRGGRWEEAESPQLPHRTASLTAARGRSHPHRHMSTVGSILSLLFPWLFGVLFDF